jgi:predicted FMN-binding regulatory protein PaiB
MFTTLLRKSPTVDPGGPVVSFGHLFFRVSRGAMVFYVHVIKILLDEHKNENEDLIAHLERENAIVRKVLWALVLSVVIELLAMIFTASALVK